MPLISKHLHKVSKCLILRYLMTRGSPGIVKQKKREAPKCLPLSYLRLVAVVSVAQVSIHLVALAYKH